MPFQEKSRGNKGIPHHEFNLERDQWPSVHQYLTLEQSQSPYFQFRQTQSPKGHKGLCSSSPFEFLEDCQSADSLRKQALQKLLQSNLQSPTQQLSRKCGGRWPPNAAVAKNESVEARIKRLSKELQELSARLAAPLAWNADYGCLHAGTQSMHSQQSGQKAESKELSATQKIDQLIQRIKSITPIARRNQKEDSILKDYDKRRYSTYPRLKEKTSLVRQSVHRPTCMHNEMFPVADEDHPIG